MTPHVYRISKEGGWYGARIDMIHMNEESDGYGYNYEDGVLTLTTMVDIVLMKSLLEAMRGGCRLILVGDADQLPSVGAGNVLADIIASGVVQVCELTHIYRQGEDSLIISNAHLINDCKMPMLNNKSKDFFFEEKQEPEQMLGSVVNLTYSRLPKYLNIDSSKIQVLAPMKSGACGVDNLNKQLQDKINPPSLSKPELETEKVIYRLGDRVMQIKNNYDIYWEKGSRNDLRTYEAGTGVFNGEIGRIERIDTNERQVKVEYDDKKVAWYAFSELDQLEHSYAITIHKAQGSEFDVVILVVPPSSNMLLTRNLLYTGITRAKKLLIVIGNRNLVEYMVNNCDTKKRNTGLKIKFESI